MALSGTIENGLMLTGNSDSDIIIFQDKIEFGRCFNPELDGLSGLLFPNFYKEYGNIVYRFGPNLKCSFWSKTIEYIGTFAPTEPDNNEIYKLLYLRFS